MPDLVLDDLNPQQYEAVTAPDGPLLIIAGAGSGKTRVITRRVAHLVRGGIYPNQIFAATFTNKAADEMKRRVAELVDDYSPRDFHIATFHSLCSRILRREASAAGLSRSFTICDERDQVSAIKHVMKQLGVSEKDVKPPDAHHVICQCKMRMLSPEQVSHVTTSHLERTYTEIYAAYDLYLRDNAALDFEDLILQTVRLFQNNRDVLHQYQHYYRHVMVDEYQDTNAVQFELVHLLASGHRNLTVVGDEDQSIYSWRGADVTNLIDFQKHFPDARIIRLEQNYRSTGNILKAAGSVIAHNKQRLGKNLFTTEGEGLPILLHVGRTELEESFAVTDTIEELVAHRGYSYQDFGVFYRISALSRIFEDRLRQRNIPYRVIGGMRFYDRAEIKDMLSYLQLAQNPGNSMALLRVINTPKRGIGSKTVQMVVDLARREQISEFEAMERAAREGMVGGSAARNMTIFARQVRDWNEFAKTGKTSDLLKRILQETEYVENLGDQESLEVRARRENLEELVNAVVLFERENPLSVLQDYLENVSLMSATDNLNAGEQAASLMTLHAAKGLEYKVVFIVGMEDTIFPNARAVMEDRDIEEERRLFYVGVTRAREILVITRSDSRVLYGNVRYNLPSAFLAELPVEIIEPLDPLRFRPDRQKHAELEIVERASQERTAISPPIHHRPAQLPAGARQFSLGQRVRHPILGEGIITGLSGAGRSTSILLRTDDSQTHKLLAAYANLEALD